ncbi:hypothetical protein DKM44_14360 [Deinococcus irradiatisoli]|uniref:DNA primase/polymerase bifunctional N-terminal domain-containing protein n=1 Tax=Deinococcus irradiatisoli TaxID=2202254 RepID=A0A2Z3JUR0_9DEIO|nr:bifunctional DNA primase/polymerase [Deinococcus irradiatisoli]AWN24264.1 hypothetical protein DKM44_14360 [Deinococcus irradiatisoli]
MSGGEVMREEALGQTELGYRVMVLHGMEAGCCTCGKEGCSSAGKHPLLSNGVDSASDDEAVVGAWRWERSNLGIATGGDLLVLDFDGPEGLKMLALLERRFPEVRAAPRVSTGRGFHVYLRVLPEDQHRPRTSVKLWPGLDTRYQRAYVVAPPSLHVSGVRYRWRRE